MSDAGQDTDETYLTAKDMRQWAQREIKEAAKAFELRVRDVTELAASYSAGEITPEEADGLHSRYYRRWGESLLGVSVGPDTSDERILKALDEATKGTDHRSRLKKRGTNEREFP